MAVLACWVFCRDRGFCISSVSPTIVYALVWTAKDYVLQEMRDENVTGWIFCGLGCVSLLVRTEDFVLVLFPLL